MSLRSGEICPGCNGGVIGVFPYVTMGCSDGKGSVVSNKIVMSLYTCGDCGFSELYMRKPLLSWKQTPAEREMEFEWLRPPTEEGPYR